MTSKPCEHCGGIMSAKLARKRYCSPTCRQRARRGTRRPRTRLRLAAAAPAMPPAPVEAPGAAWEARVRGLFEFSATESALVSLAAERLDLARDAGQSATVRLAAGTAFAALVKQLGGLEEPNADMEGTARPYVVA
jgi:hypothetical protein